MSLKNIENIVPYFEEKIEYLYHSRKQFIYNKINNNQEIETPKKKPKIVFFFGAGASIPAGGWLATKKVNQKALEALGSLEKIKNFLSAEDLQKIGLSQEDLERPDSLYFEQIMSLLREYYGEYPECAEILLFQNLFPREEIIDFERDMVPIPLIYEITSHLTKHGIVDHIISTNFDELLDRALTAEIGKNNYIKVHHLSKYESVLLDESYKHKPLLIKIHGTISYPLTLRQLVDNIKELERYKEKLLEKILENAVVIVIGYSFYNPNIQKLFYRLKMKGLLKDIFIVKRTSNIGENFIKFLLKENTENLIACDCEKFALELSNKIENIEINIKTNNKEIKEKATRFFPAFTTHLVRNTFFNKLRVYPCAGTIYLIEFIMALLKARGMMTEEGLNDCKRIVDSIKYRPLHIKSIESKLNEINRKIKKLENSINKKNKQNFEKILSDTIKILSNQEHFIMKILLNKLLKNHFKKLNTDQKNISKILKSLLAVLKGKKNKIENSLFEPINNIIYKIEELKSLLMIDANDQKTDTINTLLIHLYEAYKNQLEHLKKIEKEHNPKIFVEQFIDENKENIIKKIPIHELCFKESTCLYLKESTSSRFLENIYLIIIPKKRKEKPESYIQNKLLEEIILFLINKKIILYNSIITTVINYTSKEQKNNTITEELKKSIDKEYPNILKNLMVNFDIDIRQYQHITPIVSILNL